jgi:hypothetical protein
MKRQYSVFADYHQFYLWDANASPEAPTDYSDLDIERRIKTGPHVVVVQPERNMTVPVTLEVFKSPPALDMVAWDHVAEASLELPSGLLEVHECTGGSLDRIALAPGTYRLRACFGRLGELSEDGLEGNDHYEIAIWPAPSAPITVLKQYRSRSAV